VAGRREALQRTFAWRSASRSLIVAVIVGTALNAINQGPEIFGGRPPVAWKLGLTYLVPFLVASYGSYAAFRQRDRNEPEGIR
jgi:hypothetical protein